VILIASLLKRGKYQSKRSELLHYIKSILKWKSVGKWDERGMSLNWISCFTAWARRGGSDHYQAATSLLMEFMPQAVQCAHWHAKPCCQQCSCCHWRASPPDPFPIPKLPAFPYQTPWNPVILSSSAAAYHNSSSRISRSSAWRHVDGCIEDWDGDIVGTILCPWGGGGKMGQVGNSLACKPISLDMELKLIPELEDY